MTSAVVIEVDHHHSINEMNDTIEQIWQAYHAGLRRFIRSRVGDDSRGWPEDRKLATTAPANFF
jgi:hypothetical protein